jgi:hypothetical protein
MRRIQHFVRILLVVAILSSVAVYWAWPDFFNFATSQRSFDSELWRQGSARERGRMVHDLMASERLLGMARDGVVELLGDPERGEADSPFCFRVDTGQTFFLDPWFYTLLISFGQDGLVIGVNLQD